MQDSSGSAGFFGGRCAAPFPQYGTGYNSLSPGLKNGRYPLFTPATHQQLQQFQLQQLRNTASNNATVQQYRGDMDGPGPSGGLPFGRAVSEPPCGIATSRQKGEPLEDAEMVDVQPQEGERSWGYGGLKRSHSHLGFVTGMTPADQFTRRARVASVDVCPSVAELSEPESQSQSQAQTQIEDRQVLWKGEDQGSSHDDGVELDTDKNESQAPKPRAVSPALTDIQDPEPDYIADVLMAKGIKTRDFAYEEPAAGVKLVRELWDQYEALAEFEYRLLQLPRVYPIGGKTLRRLMDIRWITMEEVKRRCADMDMDELRKVDERRPYPYGLRFKGVRAEAVPGHEERIVIMESRRPALMRMDRLRKMGELELARRERERLAAAKAMKAIQERDRRWLASQSSQKRAFTEDDGDDGEKGADGVDGAEMKRRRMEKRPMFMYEDEASQPWSQQYWDAQPSSQQRVPAKQYPAPLSSYDPEIYPEAAGVIESQVQSQQRTRTPPPRVDTPPLDETQNSPHFGGLGQPNRGLKRTLSRAKTFTQL
ncbi:hypothetical protein FA15DRAFT_668036 [Coprinopsis marcescibilis]|uniref:Uncharacterized protein n=1 Tax=Coprinopsis marcescibilis TaxID=230819 RepID=A0A5C3KZ34_COPMA|nr:hypothetical protein FA15DRAFT_668036 [Coprinopsis marcescibilis]